MFFGQAQTDISKDMLGTLSSVRRASLDDGRAWAPRWDATHEDGPDMSQCDAMRKGAGKMMF